MVEYNTKKLKDMQADESWILSKRFDEPRSGDSKYEDNQGNLQKWYLYGITKYESEDSLEGEETAFFVNPYDFSVYDFEAQTYVRLLDSLDEIEVNEKFKLTHRLARKKKGGWKSIWQIEPIGSSAIESMVEEIIQQEKDGKKFTKEQITTVLSDGGVDENMIEAVWSVYDVKRQ